MSEGSIVSEKQPQKEKGTDNPQQSPDKSAKTSEQQPGNPGNIDPTINQLRAFLKEASASDQIGQDQPKTNKTAKTKQQERPDQSPEKASLKKEQGSQSSQNRALLEDSLRSEST